MIKFLKILIFYILIIRIKDAEAIDYCQTEGLECVEKVNICEMQQKIPVYQNGDFISFPMSKFTKITKVKNLNVIQKNVLYINGRLDDEAKLFTIFATKEFENYSMKEKETDINLEVSFKCFDETGSSEWDSKYQFILQINQTNLYAPEFSQLTYETKVPLPFIPGFECILSKNIFAIDRDIKYYEIKFTSDNPYFEVSTAAETEESGHKSFAVLKLKKAITEIQEKLEINITAEDNGGLSNTTTIILTADKQKSLPNQPRFEKPFYNGTLIASKELQIEDAVLDLLTYEDEIQFDKFGYDYELFDIIREVNRIKIQIRKDSIDDESLKDKSFLSFVIEARNPQLQIPGQTAIFIDLPKQVSSSGIQFERNLYRGKINKGNQLEIELIKLVDENLENDYKFEIQDGDKDLFQFSEVNKNELKLELSHDANWEGKPYLYLSVLAKIDDVVKASTIILIDVSFVKEDFRFEKQIFEGKINQENQLENLEIKFATTENINEIELKLEGEDSDKFFVEKTENVARIKLKESILQSEWSKKKYLLFKINARKHNFDEIFSSILINLPTNLQVPQFSEILYKGKIISKTKIDAPEIDVGDLGHSQFKLSGHNDFTLDQEQGLIKISLKENHSLTDKDLQSDYIALTLEAIFEDFGGQNSLTTIIFSTPKLGIRPEFTKSLYKGRVDDDFNFNIEIIGFSNEFDMKEKLLTGEHADYFIIESQTDGNLIVKLKKDLTSEDIKERKYFEFLVIVETTENLSNSALILVDLPFRCGDTTCPPCTTPIPSTSTTTTTEPPDEKTPQFIKELYRFSISSDSIGIFGEVNALLNGEPSDEIKYSFGKIDNDLQSRLVIHNNGDLELTAIILPGIYEIELRATHHGSSKFGKTFVIIDVSAIKVCGDGDTKVENSLLIKNLEEEQIHYGIISAVKENCHYEIISVSPNDKEYLIFNSTTNELDLISVDREALIFSDMLVVQIQFKLSLLQNSNEIIDETSISSSESSTDFDYETTEDRNDNDVSIHSSESFTDLDYEVTSELNNDNEVLIYSSDETSIDFDYEATSELSNDNEISIYSSESRLNFDIKNKTVNEKSFNIDINRSRLKRSNIGNAKAYVLTESIRNSKIETVLTIIIEDINDNKPIFTHPSPSDSLFVIGYPDVEISNNILPQHLLQVHATDLDIGLNALIRYKLDNSDFGIDEKTGIIYPYSNAMSNSDEVKLNVVAVDRNGTEEGSLSSSVEIIVKKIRSDQLVMLEFKGTGNENIKELLRKASENKDFILRSIKSATVPYKDDAKRFLMMNTAEKAYRMLKFNQRSQISTILRVWAYGLDKQNRVLEAATIMEKLSGNSDIKTESYQDQHKLILEDQNLTGFIVGIVILSIICFGCFAFMAWLFYFRKIIYERMSSPNRSEVSSFAASMMEPNSLEIGKVDQLSSSPQISSYLRRESMKISGITTQESSDYQTRMLELLNDKEGENRDSVVTDNGNILNNENMEYNRRDTTASDDDNNIPNGDIGERRKSMVTFNELVERIEIEDRRDSEISAISSERL